MTTTVTTGNARQDAIVHAVNLANVVTQAALDAAHQDVRPDAVSVRFNHTTETLIVTIQVPGTDTTAVDRLADFYDIPTSTVTLEGAYIRTGDTLLAGDEVEVQVFCRRPLTVAGIR